MFHWRRVRKSPGALLEQGARGEKDRDYGGEDDAVNP
jgi:hypothetical protein